MRRILPALCVSMLVALACASARAEFRAAQWAKAASVTPAVSPVANRGLVELSLPAPVLDRCRPDHADLRLIDAQGAEVPWVSRRSEGEVKEIPWVSATLLNRTFIPGRSTTITADFGRKLAKDAVRVKTAGVNFRRETLVESSDDGVIFRRVREGALLFRVTSGDRTEYERDVVTVPLNDQRFLRVTVFSDAGETAPVEFVAIEAPARPRSQIVPARVEIVATPGVSVTQDSEHHLTRIELDLAYRRLTLEKLALIFDDPNFFRRVTLEGRDTLTHVERSPREEGKWVEKTVETPWESRRGGAIFRYTAGDKEDASTTLPLDGVSDRYLRLTIYNADNPPLKFIAATVTRYLVLVQFPATSPGPWTLYFGNDNAMMPGYDLAHFAKRLETEGMVPGVVGEARDNPLYSATGAGLPWTERHPAILWGALVAVGLVLAVIILRQAKALKARSDQDGGPTENESKP